MDQDATQALRAASSLDDLYAVFDANRMTAGWHKKRPSLWREPRGDFRPMHWRYDEAALALDRAGEWVGTELAERRNLLLFNPVGDNDYDTVRTLVAAYQMILPGEHAYAHRHTPNALRVVLDAGPGLYTVVEGVKLPMCEGDVLLTPNWCWHSHYNEGSDAAYWIDMLDVPFVHLLEPMFYEQHPDKVQKVTSEPNGHPFAYPLAWARQQIAACPVQADGTRRFVLPATQHMPTMKLGYTQLPRGTASAPARSTASRIFAVLEGGGTARIGDLRTEWQRGDVLAVPSWTAFSFTAAEDAILFEANDEPTLAPFNLLRADPAPVLPA